MRRGDIIRGLRRALRGEKGRQVLDRAEDAARKAAGSKHKDTIRKARRAADRAIGGDDDPRTGR
jgi:hypothetical protein